ncbi:MAG: hypothetical protein AAF708_05810 [Deinococcota bacterium]
MAYMASTTHPQRFHTLEPNSSLAQHPEIAALVKLQDAGLATAEMVLMPPASEEQFYQLNNLPHQLLMLFRGVDLADPDEDDIEECAPKAQALLRSHYLLDEQIEAFYELLKRLPAKLVVRRASLAASGTSSKFLSPIVRGRPALLAVKDLWTDEWSFDALMTRLQQTQTLAPTASPVVVVGAGQQAGEDALNAKASQILDQAVSVDVLEGAICSVSAR